MNEHKNNQILGLNSVPDNQIHSYMTNAKAHTPGIRNEDVIEYYSQWAQNYDKDLNIDVYKGPQIVAEKLNSLLKDKNSRILDVGAGTGFVGESLRKYEFKNLDGLEPSKGMASVATSKKVYKNIYLEGIYPDRKTSLMENSYDAIILAGAFGEGHIKCDALVELARLAKPNGYVILIMREEYLSYVSEYANRLEPKMKQLEMENVWKLVSRTVVENYSFKKNGILFVFEKL